MLDSWHLPARLDVQAGRPEARVGHGEPRATLRDGLLGAATYRLAPAALFNGTVVPMSLLAAALVIVAWIAIPLAAGGWRTYTRDA